MKGNRTLHVATVAAMALVLVLAGCGDDEGNPDSPAGGSTATTVSVETVDGVGQVLVDSEGAALYTADQEKDGKVRCADSCAEIWIPLTVPGDREPTGPDEVSDELGLAERPGGEPQLTFDGKPLYRFADDPTGGQVTGDGLSDTFDGKLFSWQVATAGDGSDRMGRPPSPGPYG
jgi:predicted lipoprotein with Yx(FWY)xxD motif